MRDFCILCVELFQPTRCAEKKIVLNPRVNNDTLLGGMYFYISYLSNSRARNVKWKKPCPRKQQIIKDDKKQFYNFLNGNQIQAVHKKRRLFYYFSHLTANNIEL